MGQKIIISGVSFFFAASYDISPTRADHHLALLIQHPSTTRPHCRLPAPPRRFYPPDGSRGGRASTLRQMAAQCLVEQERNRAILLLGNPADHRVKRWMDGLAGHGDAVAVKPSICRVWFHGLSPWFGVSVEASKQEQSSDIERCSACAILTSRALTSRGIITSSRRTLPRRVLGLVWCIRFLTARPACPWPAPSSVPVCPRRS